MAEVPVGYASTATLSNALAAIDSEMQYQLVRWPEYVTGRHAQDRSLDEWLLYINHYLGQAVAASTNGDERGGLDKLRAVVTMGLIALEQNGAPSRVIPEPDELQRLYDKYRAAEPYGA